MILVTGGAGFIGSVLIRELNKMGRSDIILVDRLGDSDKWLNIRGLKYETYVHSEEFFSGEYEDLISRISLVFHIGACSATTEKNMDYLMVNNVEYSQILFEMAARANIPFIYASSAATYGDGSKGYSDSHDEIPKLTPLNRYGYSKQLFDEWVLKQEIKPEIWFGLKFFNVYGPGEYHKGEMRSIIHKSFGQIKKSAKVRLFKSHKEGVKDGEQSRDFVYVLDVVGAMISLVNIKNIQASGIYNMGTGKARSFKDLVTATFNSMDIEPKIEFFDMPEDIRKQYQYFTQAQMSKFNKLFPDFKFMELEKGIEDYIKNYLQTDNPYY